MNLPFKERAFVEQSKIISYLLAFDHPDGSGKAEFFAGFGFTADEWQVLANAILMQARANPVSSVSESKYGTKYRIDGPIRCPDGRSPSIGSV